MKAYVTQLLATILGFIILLVAVNLIGQKLINKKMTERNVVVDRINAEIEEIVNKKEFVRKLNELMIKAFSK